MLLVLTCATSERCFSDVQLLLNLLWAPLFTNSLGGYNSSCLQPLLLQARGPQSQHVDTSTKGLACISPDPTPIWGSFTTQLGPYVGHRNGV